MHLFNVKLIKNHCHPFRDIFLSSFTSVYFPVHQYSNCVELDKDPQTHLCQTFIKSELK